MYDRDRHKTNGAVHYNTNLATRVTDTVALEDFDGSK